MKRILKAGIFAAVFLLYFIGVRANAPLQEEISTVTLFLENQGTDLAAAREICRQEEEEEQGEEDTGGALPLCFWGEEPNRTLTCRETGSSSIVTEILTWGSPQLILPEGEALFLWEDGCLLDRETSFELFGTENAAGQIVWCQDKPCTVRGTFESSRNLMIRQVREEDGEALRAVSIEAVRYGSGGGADRAVFSEIRTDGRMGGFYLLGGPGPGSASAASGNSLRSGSKAVSADRQRDGNLLGKGSLLSWRGTAGCGGSSGSVRLLYGAGIYDSRRMVGFFFLGRLLGPAEEQSSDHPPDRSGRGAADHAWPLRDLGAGKYFFRSRVRDDAEVKTPNGYTGHTRTGQ